MRLRFIVAIGTAVSALAVAVCVERYRSARERTAFALDRYEALRRDALEIVSLRSREARAELQDRPTQEVIARVQAALADAGILRERFRDLEREGASPVTDASPGAQRYQRRSLSIRLELLTAAELGRFLFEWRKKEPAWSVTRIEIQHVTSQADRPDRYQVRMQVTASFASDASGAPR